MIRQGRIAESPEGRVHYAVIPVSAKHNADLRHITCLPNSVQGADGGDAMLARLTLTRSKEGLLGAAYFRGPKLDGHGRGQHIPL